MNKLKFASKKESNLSNNPKNTWKILIADDEPEVHTITKTVLSNFEFENSHLEFISTYSGEETIRVLKENPDVAIILLDVVMETDDAGLVVAKTIRDELHNHLVRIILRTGQPGSAPEKDVINRYEINDYKEKTELTTTKLYTTVMSALRSFRDLITIEQNRKGLSKIIEASRSIFELHSLELFAEGVLTQLISILKLNHNSMILKQMDGFTLEKENGHFEVVAATGNFKNKTFDEISNEEILSLVSKAVLDKKSFFDKNNYIGYFNTENGKANVIFMTGCDEINELDKKLIDIFSSNVSIAFNNIYLNKEIIDTQLELIETLGEVVEKRSKETSIHVRRVANLSFYLAMEYGLSEQEAIMLRVASPMHDIGKIGIRDAILLKPGKLDDSEFEEMKKHAQLGHDILKNSKREILKNASIIAFQHHEKFDGSGYPTGLVGENIHIFGRISAIADVFDALTHKRCYKEPWPIDKVTDLLKEERGKHFDPKLVDIILNNVDYITKNMDRGEAYTSN